MFILQYLERLKNTESDGGITASKKLALVHLIENITKFLLVPGAAQREALEHSIAATMRYNPHAWKHIYFPLGLWGFTEIMASGYGKGSVAAIGDLEGVRVYSVSDNKNPGGLSITPKSQEKALALIQTITSSFVLRKIHEHRRGDAKSVEIGYFGNKYFIHTDNQLFEMKDSRFNLWVAGKFPENPFFEYPEGTTLREAVELDDLLLYVIVKNLGYPIV